eukprot:gene36553-47623_t
MQVMQSTLPTASAMIIVEGVLLFCSSRLRSLAATEDGAVVGGDGGNTSKGFDAEAESTEVVAGEKVAV